MSQRSLILVTVDCLRADHAGWLGYDKPTTPFLDSLAAESITFSNAIVAGSPTYYSFPAIMASRYPLALGRDVPGLAPGEPTIASALKEYGYATAAFAAANPYLSARFGYNSGFDIFDDFGQKKSRETAQKNEIDSPDLLGAFNQSINKLSHKSKWMGAFYDELYFRYCQNTASRQDSLDEARPYPTADLVTQKAIPWLMANAHRPFFLWLHFMDAHSPYYPSMAAWEAMGHQSFDTEYARYWNAYWNRSDLSKRRLARHQDDVISLYDAGIRWVDMQLGKLVSQLHELQVWNRCIFAITADHGEEFLDHGQRYHSPSQTGEELTRVPLLIHVPGESLPKSVHSPYSLMHLAPTLLDSLDVPAPATFRGRSVWSHIKNNQAWEDVAIVENVAGCTNPFYRKNRLHPRILIVRESRYKMVIDFSVPKIQLFDLALDPHEASPVPEESEKSVHKRLLERASKHIASSMKSRDTETSFMARLSELRLECAQSSEQQQSA